MPFRVLLVLQPQRRAHRTMRAETIIRKAWKSATVSGGCHPNPRLGPILGPSRSHPGSEVVPSRFAMCFVLQCFGPIQVPRWGPSRPVLVPSCSRAFLTGSGLDGQKQTSWLVHPRRNYYINLHAPSSGLFFRDRKGTPKNFCDKDFAELSRELSGAISLKTLFLLGSALELFSKCFGAVRAIFWLWGSFLAPDF